MGDVLDSVIKGTTSAVKAPFDLAQGDTRGFTQNVGNAFTKSIDAVDDIPVVGQYIGPAVGAYFGGPLGYAAAKGIQNGVHRAEAGQSIGGSALGGAENAGLSYGAATVGNAAGSALGNYVGNAAAGTAASGLGNAINTPMSNIATNSIGNNAIGNAVGGAFGNSTLSGLGGTLLASNAADKSSQYMPKIGPVPFSPEKVPLSVPSGNSNLSSGMTPQQQSSYLATQGTYGGGLGPEDSKYFTNLINNRLTDAGNYSAPGNLSNVENSYLTQLGFGSGASQNSGDLLKKLKQYQG